MRSILHLQCSPGTVEDLSHVFTKHRPVRLSREIKQAHYRRSHKGCRGHVKDMFYRRTIVKQLLNVVPGKHRLGPYRFLPIFFCIGGVMEWVMINVRIGRETFYDVYRRKRSEREYQQKTADGLMVLDQPAAK